jgi:hypothetical protein
METLLALLRDAAHGGITIARAAIRVGRTTIEIVVKVFLRK